MFFNQKKVPGIRRIITLAASLAFVCLLLAACDKTGKTEAQRGLTPFVIDKNMAVYLPDGWRKLKTDKYNTAMDLMSAGLPFKLSIDAVMFFAARDNDQGRSAAFISIAHTSASCLSNDALHGLTFNEKAQLAQAMATVIQGWALHINIAMTVDTTEFKDMGRYEPLVFSGQGVQVSGWEPKLPRFRVAFFFLPKDTVVLSYLNMPNNNVGVDAEFDRILAAFEPDASYKPAPPPARRESESVEEYMMRVGVLGGAQ